MGVAVAAGLHRLDGDRWRKGLRGKGCKARVIFAREGWQWVPREPVKAIEDEPARSSARESTIQASNGGSGSGGERVRIRGVESRGGGQ